MSKNKKKSMKAYSFWHKVLAGFFRFFYNIKVEGLENEPSEGAYVVCANHMANADCIILGAALNNPIRFLAKKELFKIPIVSGIIKMLGAYPVDRSSAASGVNAVKTSVQLLSEGEALAMFPQGKRVKKINPAKSEIKHGIGMIEWQAKVRVLPVCIQTKGWTVLPFKRTYVRVGKPIEYEEFAFEKGGMDEYKRASALVFERICKMIDDGGKKK